MFTLMQRTALIVSLVYSLLGCGNLNISTGGGGLPNEARPTGTPVKQGQLFGSGVSGSVLIFLRSGSSYTLRFEGLSLPSQSNLVAQIYATPNGLVSTVNLQFTSGNTNYSFTTPAIGVNFQSVAIYNNQTQTTLGTAQLQ